MPGTGVYLKTYFSEPEQTIPEILYWVVRPDVVISEVTDAGARPREFSLSDRSRGQNAVRCGSR
jgi:hypothetical protein